MSSLRLVEVRRSTRPAKKLMATFDDRGARRTVHFGAASYGDFTLYWGADPAVARDKRRQYIRRHGATERWRDPTTPATLSRYILWEKPTVAEAVRAFRARFRV